MRIIILLLTGMFFVMFSELKAQKSRWHLTFGYEHLLTNNALSEGHAQRRKTIVDPLTNEKLMYINASNPSGYSIGVGYHFFKWLGVFQTHKMHFRNYYLGYPALDAESHTLSGHASNRNRIGLPIRNQRLTTISNSNQTSLQLSFRINKAHNIRWHLMASYNWENYEKNHYLEDTPQYFIKGYDVSATDNHVSSKVYETKSRITLNQYNRAQTGKVVTYSYGTGITAPIFSGVCSLKVEVGYRRIINEFIEGSRLPNNDLVIEVTHHKSNISSAGIPPQTYFSSSVREVFPIYIAGIYSNVSVVVHPFVKRDVPDRTAKKKSRMFKKSVK